MTTEPTRYFPGSPSFVTPILPDAYFLRCKTWKVASPDPRVSRVTHSFYDKLVSSVPPNPRREPRRKRSRHKTLPYPSVPGLASPPSQNPPGYLIPRRTCLSSLVDLSSKPRVSSLPPVRHIQNCNPSTLLARYAHSLTHLHAASSVRAGISRLD